MDSYHKHDFAYTFNIPSSLPTLARLLFVFPWEGGSPKKLRSQKLCTPNNLFSLFLSVLTSAEANSKKPMDKKLRRQIANCNERRRMQSINTGFHTLRLLMPHLQGEKLSKVDTFQFPRPPLPSSIIFFHVLFFFFLGRSTSARIRVHLQTEPGQREACPAKCFPEDDASQVLAGCRTGTRGATQRKQSQQSHESNGL